MQRIHIGMIAPEFPPEVGGMQAVASHLATQLAATDDVTVFAPPGPHTANGHYRQQRILSRNLQEVAPRLAGEPVDVWLAMNAGYTPLCARFSQPLAVYFNGKDFLFPWAGYPRRSHHLLRKVPYARRKLPQLVRSHRQQDIQRGIEAGASILAISKNSVRLAREIFNIPESQLALIPPGVDDVFFQQGEPRCRETFEVLTVARLDTSARRKNVDGVLKSLRLLESDLKVRYTIVGEGDDRPRLEGLARDLGLEPRVAFLGQVNQEKLLECYRNADLFVLAARAERDDVEGFGIVYLEASASGLPVICSQEGGATDAVDESVNGIIIKSSSPECIAEGIRKALKQRKRFRPDRIRAFAEGFRWSRIAARVRENLVSQIRETQRRQPALET